MPVLWMWSEHSVRNYLPAYKIYNCQYQQFLLCNRTLRQHTLPYGLLVFEQIGGGRCNAKDHKWHTTGEYLSTLYLYDDIGFYIYLSSTNILYTFTCVYAQLDIIDINNKNYYSNTQRI